MTNQEAIQEAAAIIGTNPAWLDALINFETAGTYSPTIENPSDPEAKGLIQFRDAAAQDLGYADSTALVQSHSEFQDQLYNAVIPYFKMVQKQKGITSYGSKQALYMAVFFPTYWNKPPNTPFPKWVTNANPGIDTPQDYINFVDRRVNKDTLHINPTIPGMLAIVAVGVLGFLLYRNLMS